MAKEKRIEPGAAFDIKTFYENNNFAAYIQPIDHNSLVNERDLPMSERNTVNTFYSREFEGKFFPRIKLTRKDFLLERGFLYDHLRIPHPWPVTIHWLQKNHKYPMYTAFLEDESDYKEVSYSNQFNGWYMTKNCYKL